MEVLIIAALFLLAYVVYKKANPVKVVVKMVDTTETVAETAVKEAVEAVGKVYTSVAGKTSDDKKKIALEAVEYLYKQLGLDIPKLPTWLELWILRTITSIIIDWLVGVYNEKNIFGHSTSQPEK